MSSVRAVDVMRSSDPTLAPEEPVMEAVFTLSEAGVAACAVVDPAGRPVGLLSAEILIEYIARGALAACSPRRGDLPPAPALTEDLAARCECVAVEEVMNMPPPVCSPDTELDEVLARMEGGRHRAMLVVSEGMLCGVIDETALRSWLRAHFARAGDPA